MQATGAVLALKPLRDAKSRFVGVPDPLRRQLAWCMALDTLTALIGALDRVLVVSQEPSVSTRLAGLGLAAEVLPDPEVGGLNAALAAGAARLDANGCATVVACVADLPALTSAAVQHAVTASVGAARSFVADHAGVGTTMLIARHSKLHPRFSGASAAAHRATGARSLVETDRAGELSRIRQDVDLPDDLPPAYRLGVGPATRGLCDPATGQLAEHRLVGADPSQQQHAAVAGGGQVLSTWRDA